MRFSSLANAAIRDTAYAPLSADDVLLCVLDAVAKARTVGTSGSGSLTVTLPSAAGSIELQWANRVPLVELGGYVSRRGDVFIATSAETLDASLSTAPSVGSGNYKPFERERWSLERAALSLA